MARLLVIEDDEKLAWSIKLGLEKRGHTIDCVSDGEAGEVRLALYQKEYDLAIVDLVLPDRDGIDVVRRVRKESVALPILVLTGKQDVHDKVLALDAGADDYLTKPFSFEELSARIRALLRRPDGTLPSQLEVDDIKLDTVSRQAFIHDEELALTLKEFNLLEYFMRHPNQVLNREQIYDQLWDFNANSLSNVIDVHVKNLRNKIKAKGGRSVIKTVQGVGYRLMP